MHQRNSHEKRVIALFLVPAFLVLIPHSVLGQAATGWIAFDPAFPAQTGMRSYIKDETTSGMLINFDVPGILVSKIEIDRETYHRLKIPGRGTYADLGNPELPVLGQLVEIPYGVTVSARVFKTKLITLTGYNIYPAQKPAIRADDDEPEFVLNRETYDQRALYPAAMVDSDDIKIAVIRGHRVAFIKVRPFQYNPVTKDLTVATNIEIRLEYDRPAQIKRVSPRIQSDAFEKLLAVSVLNYKPVERFASIKIDGIGLVATEIRDNISEVSRTSERARDERQVSGVSGYDYLIITHGNFYNATDPANPVVRLSHWKRQKGLRTHVVTLADLPDSDSDGDKDEQDIGDYLQDAYDNWSPPPTYVLLVGDVADNAGAGLVPTNYVTPHPSNRYTNPNPPNQQAEIGTDLYYVDVDGADIFPDMFIGRLSVDTIAQATDVIDKIIDYEQNPPPAGNFYTDTPLVALFEDTRPTPPPPPAPQIFGDGHEEPTFRIIEFAEAIQGFLAGAGYTADQVYDQSGNFAQGPLRYENGANLPGGLTIAGGFPWNGGTADISNAINGGAGIVTYDGHGSRRAWSRPAFGNADVTALGNGNLTPAVFSWACETGWFDNETDRVWLNTADNSESLAESFLRHSPGGAVGVIAASRISWDPNDFLMLGAFEAIWTNFAPNPPFGPGQLPEAQSGPLRKLGQIDVFSKVYMANYYFSAYGGLSSHEDMTFELYHVLGDPETTIWTAVPNVPSVTYPVSIGSTGPQDFVVRITNGAGIPVVDAVATLMQGDELVAVNYTDADGVARFWGTFDAGTLDLTVTGIDIRPFMAAIQVTTGGASINRLDPTHGAEGQSFNVGGSGFSANENVDIFLNDQLMTTAQAMNGEFGQVGGNDVSVVVPVGHRHGFFNIEAHGRTSGRRAVEVFHVRDANPVDLYTYSQWDSSTWHLHAGDDPTWNNPEIELFDTAGNLVQSNNLVVGHQYNIRARISNATAFTANAATVHFRMANFGAGQPTWQSIGTDQVNVLANSNSWAEIQWVPPITGHLCLKAEVTHVEDTVLSNNSGQENCHVGPVRSPARVSLDVWNPAADERAVFFEVRQLMPTIQTGGQVWDAEINHPDPQVIQPNAKGTA